VFRGANAISLDAKGRLAMPSRYRDELNSRSSGQLIVTIDASDPCLCVYPLDEWELIETKLRALPSLREENRRLQRLLIGNAVDLELEGFLPAKAVGRRSRLELLKEEPRTLIFYEAPHRILECLQDMESVFGADRPALLARELTKTFETLKGLPLAELRAFVEADSNQQRGECVVLVAGWTAPQTDQAVSSEAMRILDLLLKEMPLKRAAALAAEITGERKNVLYQVALEKQKAE